MSTDDDSTNVLGNQLVISPKSDETSKGIICTSIFPFIISDFV